MVFLRKNPFYPDNLHIHSLIYRMITSKIKKESKARLNFYNSLTALILLSVQLCYFIFIHTFGDYIGYKSVFYLVILSMVLLYYTIYQFSKKFI